MQNPKNRTWHLVRMQQKFANAMSLYASHGLIIVGKGKGTAQNDSWVSDCDISWRSGLFAKMQFSPGKQA